MSCNYTYPGAARHGNGAPIVCTLDDRDHPGQHEDHADPSGTVYSWARVPGEGTTVITGDGIKRFHVLQTIHGLTLEILGNGMRVSSRGSILNVARDRYGCQSRTKRGALVEMVALARASFGYEPTPRIVQAMEAKPKAKR